MGATAGASWALAVGCLALGSGHSLHSCFSVSTVHLWGTEEVAAWLEHLSLCEYKDIFMRHDIRGSELLHLERRDLKVLPQASSWNLRGAFCSPTQLRPLPTPGQAPAS